MVLRAFRGAGLPLASIAYFRRMVSAPYPPARGAISNNFGNKPGLTRVLRVSSGPRFAWARAQKRPKHQKNPNKLMQFLALAFAR
jgi:hypothetical protein